MASYYTPFLTQAGQAVGRGLEKRGIQEQKDIQNRLAGSAYMGDPQAMEELMQVNPQLGMKMQQQAQKRKATEEQAALAKQTRMRKLFTENKEITDQVIKDVATFDNYEDAKSYFDRKKEEHRPIFGDALDSVELTPEMYEQAKQVHGKDGRKIGTYNPRDYTVKSFAAFRQTGDPADLVRHTEKTVEIGGVPHRLIPGTTNQYEAIKTTEQVAESEATIVAAKEAAKLKSQLKFKPQIEAAVVTARKEAQERGEVLNDVSRLKAAMPGLKVAVDQLRDLSVIATSTFGGRLFDTAVKETGFGSTKGATAKAKFIAIVNNQVLPLLKPTFGGSFSVQEGAELKATMGDPDATPEQKMAQLDAFIAQKIRDIESKELQLSPEKSAGDKAIIRFDRQGQRIE